MTSGPASITQALLARSTLISQGAEAKVYLGVLHPPLTTTPTITPSDPTHDHVKVFLKHRFPKKYRHATLDGSLTRARIGAEARALARCARIGVSAPGIRFVDVGEGVVGMEWIDGHTVRALLSAAQEEVEIPQAEELRSLASYGVSDQDLMTLIGIQLAKMHGGDIIHGDLTTSNMMLRRNSLLPGSPPELVLIDFGLAYTSTLVEDKAVDLYVLERALGATHPDAGHRFNRILAAYGAATNVKDWQKIENKFADVRLRGRKRSMVG